MAVNIRWCQKISLYDRKRGIAPGPLVTRIGVALGPLVAIGLKIRGTVLNKIRIETLI